MTMTDKYEPVDWSKRLPDGSIINAEVSICQYIDPETAVLKWAVFYDGEIPLSGVLGLLDLAKLDLINRTPDVLAQGSIGNAPSD